MRYILVCSALLAGLAGALQAADADTIEKLVKQLSSNRFAEREKALKALEEIGLPAYEALKKAAETGDPESKRRAAELLAKLDSLVQSKKILSPTRIKLSFEGALLKDAIEELSKKSGCRIKLDDPDNKLKDRRVTLSTGETSFWEAFGQFCAKASLVESETQASAPAQPAPGRRPIRQAPQPANVSDHIVLKEGTPKKESTSYSGTIRVKAMDNVERFGPAKDKELLVGLALTLEPKIRWQEVINVRIDKAVDDQGQALLSRMTALGGAGLGQQPFPGGGGVVIGGVGNFNGVGNGVGNGLNGVGNGSRGTATGLYQHVPVHLTRGEKPSKELKELTGVLTVQVLAEVEILITAADILKSVGKTFKGKEGGFIKVDSVEQKDGKLTLKVELDRPGGAGKQGGNIFQGGGGQIVIQGGGVVVIGGRVIQGGGARNDDQGRLELLDEQDNVIPKLSDNSQTQIMANVVQIIHNLTFDVKEGRKPAKLVFRAGKSVNVEVPFTLKDVKIP